MGIVENHRIGISVSFSAAAVLVGLCIFASPVPILAAFVHELGHIIAMLLCGVRIERIRITLPGADISYSGCRSYVCEFVCAVAGGLFNLIFAAVGDLLSLRFGDGFWDPFALSCVGLAALNLLPALPLDGGIALRALLCLRMEMDTAELAVRILGRCTAVGIAVLAAYLLFYGIGGGLALMLGGLCVICWRGSSMEAG